MGETTETGPSPKIVKRLKAIKAGYFQGVSKATVKVKVDVQESIDGKDIKSVSQLVDGMNFLFLHWINNTLGKIPENPFVFPSEKVPSKASTRTSPPEYAGITVKPLSNTTPSVSPNSDPKLVADILKDGLSWFHGFFLTAEGKREGSEMSVQHVIGGPLHALLSLPGCNILSDQKLDYPDILKLSIHVDPEVAQGTDLSGDASPANQRPAGSGGSNTTHKKDVGKFAKSSGTTSASDPANVTAVKDPKADSKKVIGECYPDIAARLALPEGKAMNKANRLLLQPTVIIGEAKRVITGANKTVKDANPHFTVQLAMAAHPSLVLLILMHTGGEKFNPFKHGQTLDEDYFIYSLYYDEEQLWIYAQFPYYSTTSGSGASAKGGWRFAQVKLTEIKFATLDLDIQDLEASVRRRTEFAIAMQAVREHGRKLYDTFKSEKFTALMDRLSEDL